MASATDEFLLLPYPSGTPEQNKIRGTDQLRIDGVTYGVVGISIAKPSGLLLCVYLTQ